MIEEKKTSINTKDISVVLVTDCGSTTSKARFFMKKDGHMRFVVSGEAPTTVEAPYADVTVGVRNAIREIEELTNWRILEGSNIIKQRNKPNEGVDLYLSTSSAGGGLQMMVTGVFSIITSESSQRAALGAGAIVLDVISCDDGREPHENIQRIRDIRPDMILIAGGVDGGTKSAISSLIELVVAANPKHRLGDFQLPVVYAGNKDVIDYAKKMLGEKFALKIVDNLRPTLDTEDIAPARDAIHELFMDHVMSHAPGYNKLKYLVDREIMPTPWGEGRIVQILAEKYKVNAMGVGLGGATTNVYSIFDGTFNRTVSANLGMSYSISNVLKETGVENIMRWLPFEIDEDYLRDRLSNKMIRPTIIPQTIKDLMIEHAIAREALRLGLEHHKRLAVRLRGVRRGLDIEKSFDRTDNTSIVNLMGLAYLVGTGGLLSHAPKRVQSKLILMDSFQPEGVTRIVCDSIFMMPHLGVMAEVLPDAAVEILEKDCLIRLGTCIAPKQIGLTPPKEGQNIGKALIKFQNGEIIEEELIFGKIKSIPLSVGETASLELHPSRGFDVGRGGGNISRGNIEGGIAGITLDLRGRPIILPEQRDEKILKMKEWYTSINAYSLESIENLNSSKKEG